MFSDVWSENATLFERLLEIHSNPPILYYGFKGKNQLERSPTIWLAENQKGVLFNKAKKKKKKVVSRPGFLRAVMREVLTIY